MKQGEDVRIDNIKYHGFFRCILLPALLIKTLFNLMDFLVAPPKIGTGILLLMLLYYIAIVIMPIVCMVGLPLWEEYAWKTLIAYLSVLLISNFVSLYKYTKAQTLFFALQDHYILTASTLLIAYSTVYYLKRKKLFI